MELYTYNEILISLFLKRKENTAIHSNMDGPGCYYAMWNKPDTERQNTT